MPSPDAIGSSAAADPQTSGPRAGGHSAAAPAGPAGRVSPGGIRGGPSRRGRDDGGLRLAAVGDDPRHRDVEVRAFGKERRALDDRAARNVWTSERASRARTLAARRVARPAARDVAHRSLVLLPGGACRSSEFGRQRDVGRSAASAAIGSAGSGSVGAKSWKPSVSAGSSPARAAGRIRDTSWRPRARRAEAQTTGRAGESGHRGPFRLEARRTSVRRPRLIATWTGAGVDGSTSPAGANRGTSAGPPRRIEGRGRFPRPAAARRVTKAGRCPPTRRTRARRPFRWP